MGKVKNGDTLWLITMRFIKTNRKRNIIAVISIMLTALLFTSLFVGAQSLVLSKRATDIRQFMSSSHVTAQELTLAQAEDAMVALDEDKDVARYGRGIFLGSGMNPEFDFSTEVRFVDQAMAESYNCVPTVGQLPQKKNEIAVSSLILDRLGCSHELGQKIQITWEKNGDTHETQTDEFVVSGFWEGDRAVLAQLLFVTEEYAKDACDASTEGEIKDGIYNGSFEYAVWYQNLWNLEKKTASLNEMAELTDASNHFDVNPAYELMGEDGFSISSVLILLLFIMFAGYLIIYNVFSLSIRTDIRAYGLLKNIGITGKQLKKIVRMQALVLSVIGIPFGIAFGYLAAVCMAPALNASSEINAQETAASLIVVQANPLLFAAAAIFTLITVYLSCFQSCRMVECVSPVEALRLLETDFVHGRKKERKSSSFSAGWLGMAVRNMLREWKKGIIVMISIALSMLVVNCIVMLVNGYDIDSYKKIFLTFDFQIDQMTSFAPTTNFESITPEIQSLLEDCPYSESVGYVYYAPEKQKMEEHMAQTWERYADTYESYWSKYERAGWEELQKSGEINVHFLGISEAVFNKLEWKEKACSWSDFASGNYVIVDYNRDLEEEQNSYCQIGDSFAMEYSTGVLKTYTVLGEAMMPYAIDYPYADMLYITVMVPDIEFQACTGIDSAMYAGIDAKDGQRKQVQRYLDETVLKQYDMLNVLSSLTMEESFQKYVDKYYSIGAFLVAILLCIAIMNFFNTTATSVLTRKRELTILEAVGMTRRQIIKMLVAEGCIYFIGAFVIAILLVYFASETLLSNTVGQAFFFQIHLTVLPCIGMVPAFLVIAVLIPYYQYRKMSRESIVERLRNE